jgi:hypothetical protein
MLHLGSEPTTVLQPQAQLAQEISKKRFPKSCFINSLKNSQKVVTFLITLTKDEN